jgi:alpha-1,2-mannosyltransferase
VSWPWPRGAHEDLPAASPPASGDHGAPGEAGDGPGEPSADDVGAEPRRTTGLRAYWLSPVGVTIILATMLAFGLRVFILTRPGLLTGITEYDDGVYLGGAIRLTQGILPYRDYALVQPPGILLLMAPAAVVARLSTTAAALGTVRVLSVCASTACVPLAGNLMRYRGMVGTLVTCGFLAVYPDDVWTAHTLLLEPWMNLCCLIGVNAAFSRGRLAGSWRLAWAGVALGFAVSVKYWAAVPAAVLLATCLIPRGKKRLPGRTTVPATPVGLPSPRTPLPATPGGLSSPPAPLADPPARGPWRARAYLAGLVIGFAVPVAPFALAAPTTFFRSTVLYQASRVGSYVPMSLRLAHLTGLIDIFNVNGNISLAGASDSLALGSPSATAATAVGWLPFAVIGAMVAAIGIGYSWHWRRPSQLEWFALVVAVLSAAAILSYSAFFYHYPVFVAPWLALALGGAAACLTDRVIIRRIIAVVAAAAALAVASAEVHQLMPLNVVSGSQVGEVIPAGSCVVTDQVSDLISVDRFDNPPGCPDVIDALATTLVLGNGVSMQAGAGGLPAVVAGWQSILGGAQYVLLSPSSALRIPTDYAWFEENFTPVSVYEPGVGQLFERKS